MRTLILNCDFDPSTETNGAQLISSHISNTSLVIKNVFENQIPDETELRSFDNIIITGSRASVNDDLGWVRRLSETVNTIDRLNIPTLGICFGFQMIAKSLGGKVEKTNNPEEGFTSVRLTSDGNRHYLFNEFPQDFRVYQAHWDAANSIPSNSVILAENENSTQSYAVRNFICVQFHPEITPEVATKMALRDKKPLDSIMNSVNDDYVLPLKVISNFMEYCRNKSNLPR